MRDRLTVAAIRAAEPGAKSFKLFDGAGLFLMVNPNGSRWWRFRYRFAGKEKLLSLGTWPEISLKAARDARDAARGQLRQGVDPSAERKARKAAQARPPAVAETFEMVAREWLAAEAKRLKPITLEKKRRQLELHVFPHLGAQAIAALTAADFLRTFRRVETRDTLDTMHRIKQACSRIMRYAIATGRADRDPAADVKDALATRSSKHHPGITDPRELGELLRSLDGYNRGQLVTRCALRLAPLVFVRPGELRRAEWVEFDLDGNEPAWRIPGERMKMGELHLVPLSRQAVDVLRELQPLTGRGRFVFPSVRTRERPMSENTVNAALRGLGYTADQVTGHGFRTTASTLLNEQGWHPDLIELQLAHAPRNKVRAAYNRAERLAERRKMMQAWADYLDGLKQGGKIVPIRRRHR